MKIDLQYFEWRRPVAGYVWENARVDPLWKSPSDHENDLEETRFLRWKDGGDGMVQRIWALIDHPELYKTFAGLRPTEDDFLDFANCYGWLGIGRMLDFSGILNSHRAEGEPLWRWRDAHQKLGRVASVLNAIQSDDLETLRKRFIVADKGVRYEYETEFGPGWSWLSAKDPDLKVWIWKWGNATDSELERLKRFARAWAQIQINKAMDSAENGTQTSARVLFTPDYSAQRLHIVPDTLLAAMWLQCARVLTENPQFRACERCQKWFELSPEGKNSKRRHAIYCSPKCKVAAYRKREAEKVASGIREVTNGEI
jgi:hypothetical protein